MGKTNRQVGGVLVPENELRCTASAAKIDWFSLEENEDFSRFRQCLNQESSPEVGGYGCDCPKCRAAYVERSRQEHMKELDEIAQAWRTHLGKDIPVPERVETEPPEKAAWLEGTITPP